MKCYRHYIGRVNGLIVYQTYIQPVDVLFRRVKDTPDDHDVIAWDHVKEEYIFLCSEDLTPYPIRNYAMEIETLATHNFNIVGVGKSR